MTVEEIPRSFKYTCDSCGTYHIQQGSTGHYTESTPPNWMTIKTFRLPAGYRIQLWCPVCIVNHLPKQLDVP